MIAEYSTGQPQGSGTSYLTSDHLGSTRVVTDASGSVKARHDYLPFGEETGVGVGSRTVAMGYGGNDGIKQLFTTKERDNESGLDYFLARYYSGAQGRFINPDEFTGGPDELFDFANTASANPTFYADIVDPQTLNKYQYCLNNPFKYIDPDGHQEKKSLTQRLKESMAAIAESFGVSPKPFKDGDEPKDNPNSLENKNFGPGGEMPSSTAIAGKSFELFSEGTQVVSNALELLDPIGTTSIVRSAMEKDSSGAIIAGIAAILQVNEIKGITKHGINQIIERGVKPGAIVDALKKPVKVGEVVIDAKGRPSQRIIGKTAEVVINPETKVIVSVNPTSTKKAERLMRKPPNQ